MPQAVLQHERHDFVPELPELLGVVEEAEDSATEPGLLQLVELLGHLLGRADRVGSAPAGDQPLLKLLDLGPERRALDAEDVHDDLGTGPVAGLDDLPVCLLGLLLGLPADDQAVGSHVDVTLVLVGSAPQRDSSTSPRCAGL